MPWTADDVPDQHGRTFLVTGANGGLGLQTTRVLARKGATVIMACRNLDKARDAVELVRSETPDARLDVRSLDLGSLASIRALARALHDEGVGIDVLLNNAGVMAIPRRTTEDGLEMQLGTNHFGHFALTGLVLDLLEGRPGARIVNVSSLMHRVGTLQFDDLMGERRYGKWPAYCQSKLANLLFHYALARRLTSHGSTLTACAAHPGYASTDLQYVGPREEGSSFGETVTRWAHALFAQSAEMGALPQLMAATAPDVEHGAYYGPGGWMEVAGHPIRVDSNAKSKREADQERLWAVSEELTGVRYLD